VVLLVYELETQHRSTRRVEIMTIKADLLAYAKLSKRGGSYMQKHRGKPEPNFMIDYGYDNLQMLIQTS